VFPDSAVLKRWLSERAFERDEDRVVEKSDSDGLEK
jgi:hypothetical protein